MAGRIRVLDSANRTMQRLGYLKLLCSLVTETETSNLVSLGKRLIERVTKKIRISPPLDDHIQQYVKLRLTDGTYKELRKAVLNGTNNSQIAMEIQDLYLADNDLPSRTGKLVEANRRLYPYLGTSLELIKKGTYSALTRSLVLLALTPKEEQDAFQEYNSPCNPMRISDAQALLLLYCLIDNDAEVILPLFFKLLNENADSFNERLAGEFLPDILRNIVKDFSQRSLTIEERDRLSLINKTAASIDKNKGKPYTGGGAREESIRVRLEPFCDLGLFQKPNKDRYEYATTPAFKILLENWGSVAETDVFLQQTFFQTFAAGRGFLVQEASESEAVAALVQAGEILKSSLGYTPITDVGLLAGIQLLTGKKKILELGRTFELLKALQKRDPDFVRFTVDRMGALAHVKFLKPQPENGA